MKTILLALSIAAMFAESARATLQADDTIEIGGRIYALPQLPMHGYWHSADEPPEGRKPMPNFQPTSTANWRGYLASWKISEGQLYLQKIVGKIDGKRVRDREIVGKRFPMLAQWYSGKLFVTIGDFDFQKQESQYVLEFNIEHGKVTSTGFHESIRVRETWNGLAYPTETPKKPKLRTHPSQ